MVMELLATVHFRSGNKKNFTVKAPDELHADLISRLLREKMTELAIELDAILDKVTIDYSAAPRSAGYHSWLPGLVLPSPHDDQIDADSRRGFNVDATLTRLKESTGRSILLSLCTNIGVIEPVADLGSDLSMQFCRDISRMSLDKFDSLFDLMPQEHWNGSKSAVVRFPSGVLQVDNSSGIESLVIQKRKLTSPFIESDWYLFLVENSAISDRRLNNQDQLVLSEFSDAAIHTIKTWCEAIDSTTPCTMDSLMAAHAFCGRFGWEIDPAISNVEDLGDQLASIQELFDGGEP